MLLQGDSIWGFPKIRGTFLGVPIIRIIVFWGLYWGPLILGNYHLGFHTKAILSALLASDKNLQPSTFLSPHKGWIRALNERLYPHPGPGRLYPDPTYPLHTCQVTRRLRSINLSAISPRNFNSARALLGPSM